MATPHMFDYADYLFGLFKDDEARTELAAVMAEGSVFSTPWLNAAEMLEERGDLAEALVWYTMALPLDDTDLLGQMGDVEAQDKELALLTFLVEPAVLDGRMQF